MKEKLPMIVLLLNVAGILFLVCLANIYLFHDSYVPNPDAAQPMERWDAAGMALTIGLAPMLLINLASFALMRKKGGPWFAQLMCFIPSLIEAMFALHYWLAA